MIGLYVEESTSKGKRKSRIRREGGTRTKDPSLVISKKLGIWGRGYMFVIVNVTSSNVYIYIYVL